MRTVRLTIRTVLAPSRPAGVSRSRRTEQIICAPAYPWIGTQEAEIIGVIWSPNLGVFAVSAGGVLYAFPAWWTRYLDSVSAARLVRIPLSLLFLELSGYCVNTVQLHVNAADVLVRRGIDRGGSR
jgi:hypothetical protein